MYLIINMHLRCFLKEQKNFKMHFSSAANNGIFFFCDTLYINLHVSYVLNIYFPEPTWTRFCLSNLNAD